MATINVNVNRPDVQVLDLGVQKENIVEAVVFDISSWVEEYGDGVAYIYAQRKGDAEPYPVTLTMGDGTATWTLSSTDTYVKGKGKAQLVYTVDSAIKKSRVYPTFVHNSLGAASLTPPDPYDDWLDTLGDYTASIEAAVEDVEDYVDDAKDARDDAQAAATAAETAQGQAESARNSASNYALTAQSYATGDSNYRPGEATDNAKYYSEQAEASATAAAGSASDASGAVSSAQGYATDAGNARLTAEAYATGTREGQPISGTDPAYNNNARHYAEQAATEKTAAVTAQNLSLGFARKAEQWAKGTKSGAPVSSGEDGYHDNAKYYSQQAAASAESAAASLDKTGFVDFTINSSDHLIYTKTSVVAVDFDLDNRGHLIVS